MFEPVAAALAFQHSERSHSEQIVLVCDIGGGTSDFAVIKLATTSGVTSANQYSVLSTGGVYIGGNDFDSDIMHTKLIKHYGAEAHFCSYNNRWFPVPLSPYKYLSRWHLISELRNNKMREMVRQISRAQCDDPASMKRFEDLIDNNYGYRLFNQIEKAKCSLSSNYEARIDFCEGLTDIREIITRDEFEKIIEYHVKKLKLCVKKTIRDAGITSSDVDIVFMTGGSSQIPAIRNIFLDEFGVDKIVQNEIFTAVARGLGIYAAHL